MKITLDRLSKELASLSTGRANSIMLDLINKTELVLLNNSQI